ncbi:uncharacterized protein LOC122035838 [Zingiber officinale]|uniref:Uncharacterized protein n=1 Tax=Zingiber officinale TaxID=94328 RepID=A0A8J5IM30_ZINOF|nr:uncharacterized protein LOC122035838 [Zingiber officinale]KAG6537604.1 hypothetical protein ZIOFF_002699 [Zingiber officinale]
MATSKKMAAQRAVESMAEDLTEADERSNLSDSTQPLPFLEVYCWSSGKVRRFAAGTAAGYALLVINKKLDAGDCQALLIEAAKEGEEPVVFGPNAVLINYGKGWKLQTVTAEGYKEAIGEHQRSKISPDIMQSPNSKSLEKPETMGQQSSTFNLLYISKILLVFALMFMFGGALTFLLENLPAAKLSSLYTL